MCINCIEMIFRQIYCIKQNYLVIPKARDGKQTRHVIVLIISICYVSKDRRSNHHCYAEIH